MGAVASQFTSHTIYYSTVYSGADQIKHQSSASLAFVRGIHRWPMNSPHKWPATRKMFPFEDIIMLTLHHKGLAINAKSSTRSWCHVFSHWLVSHVSLRQSDTQCLIVWVLRNIAAKTAYQVPKRYTVFNTQHDYWFLRFKKISAFEEN